MRRTEDGPDASPERSEGTPERPETAPACSATDCAADASFFVYDADSGRWSAICGRHARHYHPSLEVHAWLASGYMKPVEVGEPEGDPSVPRGGRAAAFRAVIAETMGWDERRD